MPRGRQLPEETRDLIILASSEGWPNAKIAKALELNRQTIHRVLELDALKRDEATNGAG